MTTLKVGDVVRSISPDELKVMTVVALSGEAANPRVHLNWFEGTTLCSAVRRADELEVVK